MKIWVDDTRPAPDGYTWCQTVEGTKVTILSVEADNKFAKPTGNYPGLEIEVIDMDHDAGIFARFGGDYIKILDWLEETGRNYPIHIHSQNVVGVKNMRRIIRKNGWCEI